ncbi:MAG: hypothetical protein HQL54_11840 [Magnetococcales bacterium]|nr:hypothetical protein [Magnetococcales bacterium]
MSSNRDKYSANELEEIRKMLGENLGNDSNHAEKILSSRFTAAEEKEDEEPEIIEDEDKFNQGRSGPKVDVAAVIKSRDLPTMIEAIPSVREDETQIRQIIAAILKHPDVKSFHLVEALSKVKDDVQLVNALVHGIISRKGVNPLIEALKYSTCSPQAMKSLAQAVADQGTVNHVLRAIASSPRDQPEAEMSWAMEVIGKGSMEQILEAMNLIEDMSPGTVILATGLVNRKEVIVEPLVRAMGNCRKNDKAMAILIVRLVKMVDTPSLVSVLEKYVSDSTEAGEIVAAQLVYKVAREPSRRSLLASACRRVKTDSMTAQLIAGGIIRHRDAELLEKSYSRLGTSPTAQKMVALEIVNKKGKIMALRSLGKNVWEMIKNQGEIKTSIRKTDERYQWLLINRLKLDPKFGYPKKE